MAGGLRGNRTPKAWFERHFCDGQEGRPESFEAFAEGFETFLSGFYWQDRKPWAANYATEVPGGGGAPYVMDAPTWVWSRVRAEPSFGQGQARLAGELLAELGREDAALAALCWGLAEDGRSRAGEWGLASLCQRHNKPDAAWVLASLTAVDRGGRATPTPLGLPRTRAYLAALATAADAAADDQRPLTAAALGAEHDRLAAWLGAPALALGAPAASTLHPFDRPAEPLGGWTEDGLTDYEDQRQAGLWFDAEDGSLHVGRRRPREGTGTLDRRAHSRHAFTRSDAWLLPGRYRIRARIQLTTSYVNAALVLGYTRRDRNVRLGFTAGDFLYSIGTKEGAEELDSVSWRLNGLFAREGGLPGSRPGGKVEFERPKRAFEVELWIDGATLTVLIDGIERGAYRTPDGTPIEGHVGFATSMGAIKVLHPTVQRLDRSAAVEAAGGTAGAAFLARVNRAFPAADVPSHGRLVLRLAQPEGPEGGEAFDPEPARAAAARAAIHLGHLRGREDLLQPWTVWVSERLAGEPLEALRRELAVFDPAPDPGHLPLDRRPPRGRPPRGSGRDLPLPVGPRRLGARSPGLLRLRTRAQPRAPALDRRAARERLPRARPAAGGADSRRARGTRGLGRSFRESMTLRATRGDRKAGRHASSTMAAPAPPTPDPDWTTQQAFLRRVALELVGEGAADDLVQETFLAYVEQPPERPRSLRAWLLTVLRRRGVDRAVRDRRRRAREALAADRPPAADPGAIQQRLELVRRLADAVLALPEPCRSVLYLRAYEDRPVADIARELDVPPETVRSRLKRARGELRRRLDADHGGRREAWAVALVDWARPRAAPASPVPTTLATGVAIMGMKTVWTGAAVVAAATLVWVLQRDGAETVSPSADADGSRGGAQLVALGPQPEVPPDPAPRTAEVPSTEGRSALTAPAVPTTGALSLRATFESSGLAAAGLYGNVEVELDPTAIEFQLGERGQARVDGLDPGPRFVNLHGYGRWLVEVTAGEVAELELSLPPGPRVEGLVLGPEDRPVPGAEVFVARRETRFGTGLLAVTDAHGRFALADLKGVRIAARAPGFLASHTWEASGVPGQTVELVLRLQGVGATLRGRVIGPGGEPVSGVDLYLPRLGPSPQGATDEGRRMRPTYPEVLVTDERGRFETPGAPEGSYSVRVASGRHPEQRVPVRSLSGVAVENEIRLTAGGSVRGVVRDGSGSLRAGVSVSIHPEEELKRFTVTDAEGGFAFEGVEGKALVAAGSRDEGEGKRQVTVAAGQALEVELVLVSGAELRGVLVDDGGAPLADHRVCVIRPGRDGLWLRESVTDAEGRFHLVNAPEGPKALEVRYPKPFAVPPLLTAPWPEQGDARLVVPGDRLPTASLRLVVQSEDGLAIPGARVWLSARDRNWGQQILVEQDQRALSLGPLQPGNYDLRIEAQGCVKARAAVDDLRAQEVRDLGPVTLVSGGVVQVDVTRSDGRPIDFVVGTFEPVDGSKALGASMIDGPLRSEVLPPGEYRLRFHGSRVACRTVPVTVVAGESIRLSVELDAGVQHTLRFEPDAELEIEAEVFGAAGEPFEGHVQAFESHGVVQIYGLSPGSWRVRALSADGRSAELGFEVVDWDQRGSSTLVLN